MPRFFVSPAQVGDGLAWLDGADAAHLARSLRARPGELVVVVDGSGLEHEVRLDRVAPGRVEGTVVTSRAVRGEPRLHVHVLQALPQQGMDDAIEAMVQVGAASIRPFLAERGVARPDAARLAARGSRWTAVAREAAGLAHRGLVPPVEPAASLADALDRLSSGWPLLVGTLDATTHVSVAALPDATDVALVVGPEGGLTAAEVDLCVARGGLAVSLGPRVLRARLAGAVAVALLLAPGDAGPAGA